jgi:hypothetical protein
VFNGGGLSRLFTFKTGIALFVLAEEVQGQNMMKKGVPKKRLIEADFFIPGIIIIMIIHQSHKYV